MHNTNVLQSPSYKNHSFCNEKGKKSHFIIGEVSLGGDIVVVFYYHSASEIRPDKRVAFDGRAL
jgi:hypothetical protein